MVLKHINLSNLIKQKSTTNKESRMSDLFYKDTMVCLKMQNNNISLIDLILTSLPKQHAKLALMLWFPAKKAAGYVCLLLKISIFA